MCVRIVGKFCCDGLQPVRRTNRRATNHANPAMKYVSDDAVSGAGEPQLDPGIEKLIRRGVPAELED